MTKDQAQLIKKWRVTDGCSWRKIAELAFSERITYAFPNQQIGIRLCEIAADILGENPAEEPWN